MVMEADMEILTFLFWRLFILKATASILGGLYLCIKGNKISTVTIQKNVFKLLWSNIWFIDYVFT